MYFTTACSDALKNKKKNFDYQLFIKTLRQVASDDLVKSMVQYRQHGSYNTFRHCYDVTKLAGRLAATLNLDVNEVELARGGMLHDFFLYDIHSISPGKHGFGHAAKALEMANLHYDLTATEKDIIYNHMWPLNITHFPRSREARLISIADKICATRERGSHIIRWFVNRIPS